MQFVRVAAAFEIIEVCQAPFDALGKSAVKLSAGPDRPQQKLRVVEMPQKPARQMEHDVVPPAADSVLAYQNHRRRMFVGRRPANQAEYQIVVPARAGRDAEAAQVGASVALLAERIQPVQRRDRIMVGEAFGG